MGLLVFAADFTKGSFSSAPGEGDVLQVHRRARGFAENAYTDVTGATACHQCQLFLFGTLWKFHSIFSR